MTNWATSADVKNATGAVVTEDAVLVAQTIVEIFAGTTTDASDAGNISSTNLRYLRLAVCYQARWLQSHPDALDGIDVEGISQDGVSGTYANSTAAFLAPLAKRCIDRLSWKNQSVNAYKPLVGAQISDRRATRDSAAHDDMYQWEPM